MIVMMGKFMCMLVEVFVTVLMRVKMRFVLMLTVKIAARSRQSRIDVHAKIDLVDFCHEAGLTENGKCLRLYAGHHETDVLVAAVIQQTTQDIESGRVKNGDFAHAEDDDFDFVFVDATQDKFLELGNSAEKERSLDFKDFYAFWNDTLFDGTGIALRAVSGEISCDFTDFAELGHAANEEERCQNNTDFNGDGQIHQNSENEGDKEDDDISARPPHDAEKGGNLTHIIADNEQNTAQRREGNHLDIGAEKEQNAEDGNGMNDTGDGGFAPCLDVGGGTGDRSGGGKSAKERGTDVADALGNQLCIGLVPATGHPVCNGGTEQRLNRGEQGNGKGGRDELRELRPVESMGQSRAGQSCGQVGITLADSFYAEAACLGGDGRDQHAYKHSGELGREFARGDDSGDGENADAEGCKIGRTEILQVTAPFCDEGGGNIATGHGKPQNILHLSRKDGQRDPGSESGDDGEGNKSNKPPHFEQPKEDHEDPRNHGADDKSRHAELRHDAYNDNDEGSRRPPDLNTTACGKGHQPPGDDSGD